ncbi:MAG: hypothetical protein ACON5A_03600 [Candidatus Comchoanobacterales bacterium]
MSAEDVEAALIENKLFDNWVETKESTDKMLVVIFKNPLVKKFVPETNIDKLLKNESVFTGVKIFSESRWYNWAFKGMVKLEKVVNLTEALFNDMNFYYINEYMHHSKKKDDEASVYIQYFLNQYKDELNFEVNGYVADVDSRPSSPNDSSLDEHSDNDSMVLDDDSKVSDNELDKLGNEETKEGKEELIEIQENKSSNDSMETDDDSKVLVNESKEPEDDLDLNKIEEGKDEYTESHEKKSSNDSKVSDNELDELGSEETNGDTEEFAESQDKKSSDDPMETDDDSKVLVNESKEPEDDLDLNKIEEGKDEYTESHEKKSFKDYYLALIFDRYIDGWHEKLFTHDKIMTFFSAITQKPELFSIELLDQLNQEMLENLTEDQLKTILQKIGYLSDESSDVDNLPQEIQKALNVPQALVSLNRFLGILQQGQDSNSSLDGVFDDESKLSDDLASIETERFTSKDLFNSMEHSQQQDFIESILSHHYVFWAVFKTFIPWASLEEYYNKNDDNKKNIENIFNVLPEESVSKFLDITDSTPFQKKHLYQSIKSIDMVNICLSKDLNDVQYIPETILMQWAEINMATILTQLIKISDESRKVLSPYVNNILSDFKHSELDKLRLDENINTDNLCDLLNHDALDLYAKYLKDKELSDDDKIDVLWSVCRDPQFNYGKLKPLFDGFGYNFSKDAIRKVQEARQKCDEDPKSFSVFSESEMEATDMIKIVKKIALGAKSSDKHQRLDELDQKTTNSNHWKRWSRWARNKNKFSYSYVLKEFQKQKKQLKKETHKPSNKNEI